MKNKNTIINWQKWIYIFLILIAIHSFLAGIFLMIFSSETIHLFGFNEYKNNFFRAQGGIFHIVMAVAYILPVINFDKFKNIIIFSISAKVIAAFFLTFYYLFWQPILTILLSGIADLLMGLFLLFLFQRFLKTD